MRKKPIGPNFKMVNVHQNHLLRFDFRIFFSFTPCFHISVYVCAVQLIHGYILFEGELMYT